MSRIKQSAVIDKHHSNEAASSPIAKVRKTNIADHLFKDEKKLTETHTLLKILKIPLSRFS